MLTTYTFRLYPTKPQKEKLLWTKEQCRLVYNSLLEELNTQKKSGKSIDRNKIQHSILQLKEAYPQLKEVYSKTLQYECYRLFSNLSSLAAKKRQGRKRGQLRFKGKQWFKSFTYNQSGFAIIAQETRYDQVHLAKIGNIPMIMHRDIEGNIKQITIKHTSSGKWFCHIAAEKQEVPMPPQKLERKVGIDLGTLHYTADSDGHIVNNPKHLKKSLEKLAKRQQELSNKQKGSKNRKRARIKVARVHEKIVNQRNDFIHKLSRYYVNEYTFIAVEALQVANMVRNPYLSQSIMDASWSKFIQMLCTKAESAGCKVMTVEPRQTSQQCSKCGSIVKKTLAVRVHRCSNCGLTIDRDINAATNILKKAIPQDTVGQELPEYTPVEIRTKVPIPPLFRGLEQVRSLKQDAQPFRAE